MSLADTRAAHLLNVLRVPPEPTVRIGLLDGPLGVGTVEAVNDGRVTMRCAFETCAPQRPRVDILLALPRLWLPRTSYMLRRLRLRAFSDSLQLCAVVLSLLHSLRFVVRSRASLHLEIIALRHQLAVVHRSRRPRLRFTSADRILWASLSHAWRGWRSALPIIKPETVIAWHRRGFRLFRTLEEPTPHRPPSGAT